CAPARWSWWAPTCARRRPPPTCCSACWHFARTRWPAASRSAWARPRGEPAPLLRQALGHLALLAHRRDPGALHLPPGPAAAVADRRLPALALAAGGRARAGARRAAELGEALGPPGADRHRVHDPDALSRRAAVPAAGLLGCHHAGLAEHVLPAAADRSHAAGHDRPLVPGDRASAAVAQRRLLPGLHVRRAQSRAAADRRAALPLAAHRRLAVGGAAHAGRVPGARLALDLRA